MWLDDKARATIEAAIKTAEAGTDGEVILVVAPASDPYHDVALWWSLASALLGLTLLAAAPMPALALFEALLGGWHHVWTPRELLTAALVVAAVDFWLVHLLLKWRPLRRALVPAAIRRRRVRRRAIELFRASTERRTASRTGVLLYLSLAEHQAEIVADETIHARVPEARWGEAMAALVGQLRDGRPASGICAAIAAIGAILAEVMPRTGTDPDELPNRMIEL